LPLLFLSCESDLCQRGHAKSNRHTEPLWLSFYFWSQ
jgi:hypothetical protein